jgi:hypothetical protein
MKQQEEDMKQKLIKDPKATVADAKQSIILSEKATQTHQKLLQCIDAKITLEMNFMANVEKILTKEQKTKLAYEKDPDVLSRMKNKILQLDHTKYEFLLEKISKLSILPAFERAKGTISSCCQH